MQYPQGCQPFADTCSTAHTWASCSSSPCLPGVRLQLLAEPLAEVQRAQHGVGAVQPVSRAGCPRAPTRFLPSCPDADVHHAGTALGALPQRRAAAARAAHRAPPGNLLHKGKSTPGWALPKAASAPGLLPLLLSHPLPSLPQLENSLLAFAAVLVLCLYGLF